MDDLLINRTGISFTNLYFSKYFSLDNGIFGLIDITSWRQSGFNTIEAFSYSLAPPIAVPNMKNVKF